MSRTSELRVSAPGKLYLFGEYAVLAGGWSIVAAIDRRVSATRFEDATDYRAVGLREADEALPRAVLEEVESATGRSLSPGRFETDVREMQEGGTKLGLGSSAASAVALAGVAMAEDENEVAARGFRQEILSVAERAHAAFQGGVGSGGAVPAAALGGVLGCRRREPTSAFQELTRGLDVDPSVSTEDFVCEAVELPGDVEVRAVWLGTPASTPDFVRTVEHRMRLEPGDVYRCLGRIAEIAEEAIRASGQGDEAAFVDAVGAADRAMEELGRVCELPVVVGEHLRLREVADAHELSVKPSGAGGGDFSLVVGLRGADWAGFEAALPAGLSLVELGFGAEGVRAENY